MAHDDEPQSDPTPDSGMEMSLDELGRAYARAVGRVSESSVESGDVPEAALADACEISPKTILEAILFVGVPPDTDDLTARQIASWIRDVSPREIRDLAVQLNREYEEAGAAYRIQHDGERLRLVLAEPFHPMREAFYGEVRMARLSQQAVDVLAIVAYHQPTTREHVSELRFRDCGAILSQLVRRGLLAVEPDEQNPRVRLYRTTDRFLELFGLESLEDLPQSAESLLPDADPGPVTMNDEEVSS